MTMMRGRRSTTVFTSGAAVLLIVFGSAQLLLTPPAAAATRAATGGELRVQRIGPAFDESEPELHVCDFSLDAVGFAPGSTVSYAFARASQYKTHKPHGAGTIVVGADGRGNSGKIWLEDGKYKPFFTTPDGEAVLFGIFHVDRHDGVCAAPETEPTTNPTVEPTVDPTVEATVEPSVEPTVDPSVEPTTAPPIVTVDTGGAAVAGPAVTTGGRLPAVAVAGPAQLPLTGDGTSTLLSWVFILVGGGVLLLHTGGVFREE
jgi:hypothetical protein